MTLQTQPHQALGFHQHGQLGDAEPLYLLQTAPGSFEALHVPGVVRAQQNRNAETPDLIGTAVTLNNCGNALAGLHQRGDDDRPGVIAKMEAELVGLV